MNPSETVSNILQGTNGRSDAVFLSVIVIVLCGVILCGVGYIAIKWMPQLLQNFRDEMKLEREFHQLQLDKIVLSNEKTIERICSAVREGRKNV